MQSLTSKIETLNTREDFISFLELLINDLRLNSSSWENNSLEAYLEAISSWTEDMDGYYENMNMPLPQNIDWQVFANILMAAKMYE